MDNIIDRLVEYSGCLFEIQIDNLLPISALSRIRFDHRNKMRFEIFINPLKIPMENESILAHILSHEWGHHMYNHVRINPNDLDEKQMRQVENEADFYASLFIEKYNYSKEDIVKYIVKSSLDKDYIKNRVEILGGDFKIVEENLHIIDKDTPLI